MSARSQELIPEFFNEQELLVFDRRIRAIAKKPAQLEYAVEPRITAVEVVLIYEQGGLTSALTPTGPVTTSVKTILTVPLTFVPLRKESPVPDYLEIIADVYMEEAALAQLNQERREKNLRTFPDSRMAVEDSLCQTDARISAKRTLNYFCSGCGKRTEVQAATHYELMMALQELGLRVNRPHIHMSKEIFEVIDHCRHLRAVKWNFPYPVEGARIRLNSLELQERICLASGNQPGTVVFRF